jgi:hypothetical protein
MNTSAGPASSTPLPRSGDIPVAVPARSPISDSRSPRAARATARRLHKWAGLFAFVWLAVLGGTGFLMNHREDWDWLWQRGLPASLFPDNVVKIATAGLARHLQIDPAHPAVQITAGVRGAWWSDDAGKTWQPSATGLDLPLIVHAVEPAPGWSRIWFATHDGLWLSTDAGRSLTRFALAGTRITALALGSHDDELIGVADRRRVFRLSGLDALAPTINWLDLAPAAASTTAPGTHLSRLFLDLHYGRGFFGDPWDEWLNDLAGLGLATLCLTGLLLWFFPLRWRRRRERGDPLPPARPRKNFLVWLLRLHAKWLGPVLVLPLAMLFVTGIYIGHFSALSPLFKATPVGQSSLPPTYALRTWTDWIECVAAYPGQPHRLSLGTRTGLFTSDDDGRTWRTETAVTGGVLRLRRVGDDLLAPNGMSGTAQRLTPAGWRPVAPAGSHLAMASEVTPLDGGRYLWKHGTMLHVADADGRETGTRPFAGPRATIVPFYTLAARLHSGALFWKEWEWINDAFALAGLVLLGTGFVRWWPLVRPARRPPPGTAISHPRAPCAPDR